MSLFCEVGTIRLCRRPFQATFLSSAWDLLSLTGEKGRDLKPQEWQSSGKSTLPLRKHSQNKRKRKGQQALKIYSLALNIWLSPQGQLKVLLLCLACFSARPCWLPSTQTSVHEKGELRPRGSVALTFLVSSPGPLGLRKWFLSAPGALGSSLSFTGKSSFLSLWATTRDTDSSSVTARDQGMSS